MGTRCYRNILRPLAALLVFASIVTFYNPIVEATGRDFSRCVQGCNQARKTCIERCPSECVSMFPGDETAQQACIDACRGVCNGESKECKVACQAFKDDESPEIP